jgi:hypothetical protein
MSFLLNSYRRNAEKARAEAATASLPNVRARAAQAAIKWQDMADNLEWVEEQGRHRIETAAQARAAAK